MWEKFAVVLWTFQEMPKEQFKKEKWQNPIRLFLFLLNSCRQCSTFFPVWHHVPAASSSARRDKVKILQLLVKPNVYSDNEDAVQKDICEKNHFESQNGRSRKTNIAIMLISFSIVHPVRTKLSQTSSNKGRLVFSVPSHEDRNGCGVLLLIQF